MRLDLYFGCCLEDLRVRDCLRVVELWAQGLEEGGIRRSLHLVAVEDRLRVVVGGVRADDNLSVEVALNHVAEGLLLCLCLEVGVRRQRCEKLL